MDTPRSQDSGDFNFNHRELLLRFIEEFDMEKDDFCLIGSMPLHVHGIRENKDVDIIAREEVRKRIYQEASNHSGCSTTPDGQIYYGPNDFIEIGPKGRFNYLGITNDELVDNTDYHMDIDGFKVMRLELAVSKKYAEGRPKDMEDIGVLEEAGVFGSSDWDWDLVRFVSPWEGVNEKSLFERGMYSLRFRGLAETIKIALYYFSSRSNLAAWGHSGFQTFSNWQTHRGVMNLKSKGLTLEMPIASILSTHYDGGDFTAWDIIVSCIEQSAGNREYSSRTSEVAVAPNGRVLSNEEVLAQKMLGEDFSVSVNIQRGDRDAVTLNEALSDTEYFRDELESTKHELFKENGVYFYSILWPSTKEYFDEIEAWLNQQVTVIESDDYHIPRDEFAEFVHRIYDLDERSRKWVIEKKIHELCPDDGEIRFLTLEVSDPQFGKGVNPVPYSRKIRSVKRDCRKTFSEKVEQYTYDNIIHTTDNFEHNYQVRKIVERFTPQH